MQQPQQLQQDLHPREHGFHMGRPKRYLKKVGETSAKGASMPRRLRSEPDIIWPLLAVGPARRKGRGSHAIATAGLEVEQPVVSLHSTGIRT